MANDYYNQAFTGQRHGLVKVEQFIASLNAIEGAFVKLPGLRALLEDRVSAFAATGGPVNFTVTMTSPPSAYTDGIALQVRFPVANEPNPTLDILDENGVSLGAKAIKQVDGTNLSDGHIAENARAELYYVAEGAGFWTLGAGARGAQGQPGPPAGTFSLDLSTGELQFTPTGGAAYDVGRAIFQHKEAYSSATEYSFLDIVTSGGTHYLHIGTADTTGTAVTDTSVWLALVEDGRNSTLHYAFSTSTTMADPTAGDIRLNHATPNSVTRIAIDDTDADGNDLAGLITSWDDRGVSADYGTLFIRDRSNEDLLAYRLTGVTDNSGWTRLDVTHLAGSSLPADDAELDVWFMAKGAINIVSNTENEYTALATKDSATFYISEA